VKALLSFSILALAVYAQPSQRPEALFEQNCAACHTAEATSAPARADLAKLTPEAIFLALSSGKMRVQAASLNEAAKRSIAEFLTNAKLNLVQVASTKQMPNQCPANPAFTLAANQPAWNGWGAGVINTRFQNAPSTLTAAQIPNLKLKWSFGFPGVSQVYGQPAVAGGRLFLGVDTGFVYSLNADTGCVYWSFAADAGVRTTITIARLNDRYAAYFGDLRANAYAIDAHTGELIWKTRVDNHAASRITGAPQLFENRLYVPVASGEEGSAGAPGYQCCTFRGSIVALDAANGRQIWKSYTIPDEPKPTTKSSKGVQLYAPSGGAVWSAPTIDAKRRVVYAGTGDAYSEPAAATTDAIVAFDLDTGKMLWSVQDTANDVWVATCMQPAKPEPCPKDAGPDQDYGSPPQLVALPDGRTILVAGQKSGNVWAHDPDKKGAVLWRTALVKNTTEFGGKIVWGGASDMQTAYFGLGPGGIGAVQLRDGERKWFTELTPAPALARYAGQDGALTAISGAIFSGGWDGVLRALDTATGRVIWEYNTVQSYTTINNVSARGGSLSVGGPTVAGKMLYVGSGYTGVRAGMPGNVLLAFE
jgi:polyvinyl alcohol dehydrogenase (cytochrome)